MFPAKEKVWIGETKIVFKKNFPTSDYQLVVQIKTSF